MNATEIENKVLQGSHSEVKAFLAPLIAAVQGEYNGCGGIFVDAPTWAEMQTRIKTVRAEVDRAEWKVSKPWAVTFTNDPFNQVRCYRLQIKRR